MTDVERLLNVQAHDTQADQLRHRRATLPERARIVELTAAIADIDRAGTERDAARTELVREQKRREDELALLEEKIKKEDAALYGGGVSNPRELQALQEEISGMKRRVSTVEDAVIELLEQIEPLDTQLSELAGRRGALAAERAAAERSLTVTEAEIDAELAAVEAERTGAVAGIAAELLAEYEQIRGRLGGVAVARLVGNRCEGCHLTMAAAEVERLKRPGPGSVPHCEECGRLLVTSTGA